MGASMGILDRVNEFKAQREERKEIRSALDLHNDKFW
jgi:hypothetical protein